MININTDITNNDVICNQIEKENAVIIELEDREEINNEKNQGNNSVRNVNNRDSLTEDRNHKAEHIKYDVVLKNKCGPFGDDRKKSNIWVQFLTGPGMQIPPGGGDPLDYEPESRNKFVLFVLLIVFIMLLCTAMFNVLVYITDELRDFYLRMGFIIVLPAMLLFMILNYAMACSPCTRMAPCNYICLVLAVIAMSNICAFITVRYATNLILYALISTTLVMFVCMLLALSNFDFTKWMIYVVVISVAFCVLAMVVSLTMVFTGTYFKTIHLIILFGGTILNCVILIIELQTILGGRAVELSEDDYALGAFLIYTSVIDIFIRMLQIIGLLSDG